MRWLLLPVLMSCGCETPCNDAPLTGLVMCTPIDGVWRLGALETRPRCGARLLSNPLTIRSSGSHLEARVETLELVGVNYESGAFMLEPYGGIGQVWLRGEYRVVDGEDELIGSVVSGGPGQTCDAMWDFRARRQ